MNAKPSATGLPNALSPAALHRRQMLLQVWLPLAASIIVFLALAILTIVGAAQGSPAVEKWGNLSAIYILLPVLFVGLLILALVGGAVYGMRKLLGKMPYWMMVAQAQVANLSALIRKGADAAASPVFAVHMFTARVRALQQQIKGWKP